MEEQISRLEQKAMVSGIAALAVSLIFGLFNMKQFLQSYLLAYAFFIGIGIGSMAILMLHQLTGGMWGAVIRRFLEAATRTIPLLALLFLPILLGLSKIYIWAQPAIVANDEILKHKQLYLNVPFFAVRALIYFSIWMLLVFRFRRLSAEQDQSDSISLLRRFQVMSGFGLLLYGLTMTFAAVDWFMSLEPHWFSTIYGLLIITGQVLNAFAFVIVMAFLFGRFPPLSDVITPMQFKDLGNLLLTFVMLWAYLSFSQLLIIWSANLPEEIPWYLHRLHAGWQWLGGILIVFHFAIPFLVLLSRQNKSNAATLVIVALGLMLMRLFDLFWLIGPEFHQQGFSVHILDFLLPIALGGIWLSYYCRQLKALPIVAVNDPNFSGAEI